MKSGGMVALSLIVVGALAVLVAALLYRRLWSHFVRSGRVPTGFGALLAPAMLAAAVWCGASKPMVLALIAVSVGSLVYWLDDAKEMSARARIVIALVTGLIVGAIYFGSVATHPVALIGSLALAAFVNLALVNTFNMQDGADLNFATFVLLTAVLLMLYGGSRDWASAGAACLAFTAPFAILNARPKTLYFGDSGTFAFAGLFTIMGAAFLTGGSLPLEAAIPAGLPLVDMAFVTAHRIRIRQKFTVRHYFHLYQRLQSCRPGFVYLVPQALSVALALLTARALQAAGLEHFPAICIAIAVSSLGVFWACHLFLVEGEPGPPPQKATA